MQTNLLGEPERDPALCQWHTPAWIARKLAAWVPRTARVLEPGCGSGNLIDALLRQGHDPARIVGVELDERWAAYCFARFGGRVQVVTANFLKERFGEFDVVLHNPPFDDSLAEAFLAHALAFHAPRTAALLPCYIEFGEERDRVRWAHEWQVMRRARLAERVKYGGDFQARFETIALKIDRRTSSRGDDEVRPVIEEVWRREAA